MRKQQTAKKIRQAAGILLCLLLMIALPGQTMNAQAASSTENAGRTEKTVRVGYVNVEGYESGGEGEYKTGFGYEYLQKVSYYTGWEYEYVYGSFGDLFQKLKDGDIDLMGDVSYLPEREKYINYSDYVEGNESYYIYTTKDHKELLDGETASLNGKKVGLTAGSYQQGLFEEWMQQNDVQAQIVPYDGYDDLISALQGKTVDAVLLTDAAMGYGYEPIYEIGISDFYFAVAKNRTDLLEELNDALYKIQTTNPDYNSVVSARYANRIVGATYLDNEERGWLTAHDDIIRIGYLNNNLPYSGVDENGQLSGALVVLSRQLEENFDITVQMSGYDTMGELARALSEGEIDAYGPGYGDFYLTELADMVQTDPLITMMPAVLYKGNGGVRTNRIAVTDHSMFYEGAVRILFPDSEPVLCEDENDCLQAIATGKADCMIVTSAKLNIYKQFKAVKAMNHAEMVQSVSLCMFTGKEDYILASILDKGINLSSEELNSAMFRQSVYDENAYSVLDFIKDNLPGFIAVLLAIGIAIVIILLFLRRAIKAEQRTSQLNEELLKNKENLEVALAAAEQANHSKTTFLNSMSHDIRTPMNGIIGMTAIAQAHIDDKDRVRECLKKIMGASNHLLSLINDVLDVSRIESGSVLLTEEEFNLSELLENTINMTSSQIANKNQELILDVCDITHEEVIGDSLRLQQVFMNIVSNAIKYTPSNGKITLSLTELPGETNICSEYVFVCEDNGYGMSKEFLDKLFIPFERAEDERLKGIQGTGLGMVITRNILHMMDGDIKVESEYGEGSKFIVNFRLKRQDDLAIDEEFLQKLSILVVDDDQGVCESTCMTLGKMGIRNEYVVSGRKAVEVLKKAHERKKDFDLCLLDWKIPGEDCMETIRSIRQVVSRKETALIIISSYDWSTIEVDARAAGADALMSKPLFKSKLISKIRSVLDGNSQDGKENVLEEFAQKNYEDKRILLVEDNELNREIAEEILGMTGVKVETAEDGSKALKMFEDSEENYYDMILMDIQMPVMNGHQATRAIRQLKRPDAMKVPIVAMSANAFMEDVESSRQAGMNAHISKPINLAKLLDVMEDYMGKQVKRSIIEVASEDEDAQISPMKYYEELYVTEGGLDLSEDNEKACIDVLDKNGAVGIFGLLEQRDFPIYCVSGFALTALGYTFAQLQEETEGYFIELVCEEDRTRFVEEFYDGGHQRRRYRLVKRDGELIPVVMYAEDTKLSDGTRAKMLSMRVEAQDGNENEELDK